MKLRNTLTLAVLIFIGSCDTKIKGDFDVVGTDFILLSDPDDLMNNHITVTTALATLIQGDLPAATNDITAPSMYMEYSSGEGIDSMNIIAGIPNNWRCFVFNDYRTVISGIYVKVVGAHSYFRIPLVPSTSTFLRYSIRLEVPENIASGRLDFVYGLYDDQGRVGRYFLGKSEVVRLGGDFLQIALTWDTDSTDLDLHVFEPSGEEVYWNNRHSTTGGEFFQDHNFGYGPELVRWLSDAPDGEYTAVVDYYWDNSEDEYGYSHYRPTNFTVKIDYHQLTELNEYDGLVNLSDLEVTAVTFEKNGSVLSNFQKKRVLKTQLKFSKQNKSKTLYIVKK